MVFNQTGEISLSEASYPDETWVFMEDQFWGLKSESDWYGGVEDPNLLIV